MTVTAKALFEAKLAEGSDTTQYTSTGVTTIIDKFTATNVWTDSYTISVNLVASGGTASAANLITSVRSLAPNESYTFPELVGHVLAAGDFISAACSVNNVVVIRASGRQIT